MIPVTQTVLHDPENGKFGNCFSAVLASLLHLPIEEVPLFIDPVSWRRDLNTWLRPYGLAYLDLASWSFKEVFAEQGISGCFHEVAGVTERFTDVYHACVAYDGETIFDPHPSSAGLKETESCGFFIALEPWRLIK